MLACRGRGLDALPGLLEARALLAENETSILVFLGHDQGVDHLAEFDLFLDVDALADGQFGERDHALALEADIDENLVLVDPDDPPVDHVPFAEERDGGFVVRHHLAVDLDVFGAVEGAHGCVEFSLH